MATIHPMTLGNALDNQLELIVGCEDCEHSTSPDVRALVLLHGRDLPVPQLATRGRCSACGSNKAWVRVIGYKPPSGS